MRRRFFLKAAALSTVSLYGRSINNFNNTINNKLRSTNTMAKFELPSLPYAYDALEPHIDKNDSVLIYSMWKEYINQKSKHVIKRYLDFVEKFPTVKIIRPSVSITAYICVE